ncbi:hypothetical protein [Aureibaculum marinum]|nr:hypothetical protein [Aureibaculum marinum]
MKTSFFKQVLLLLIMCSISCTPVDGEMGPQGPAGENGKDGNVNIISSG